MNSNGSDDTEMKDAATITIAGPASVPFQRAVWASLSLEELDDELLCTIASFLPGYEFVHFTGASRALHSLASVDWAWREIIQQEFGRFDRLDVPTRGARVQIDYPVDAIVAHNAAVMERSTMDDSLHARAGEDGEDHENHPWRRRQRDPPIIGAKEPFEGVVVKQQVMKGGMEETKEQDSIEEDAIMVDNEQVDSTLPHSHATSSGADSVPSLISSYIQLHSISRARRVRWFERRSVQRHGQSSTVRPMHSTEGHTMVAVQGHLILLCGFERFGPTNEVYIRSLQQPNEPWQQAKRSTQEIPGVPSLHGAELHGPRQGLYGCIACALDDQHVLLVSGYRSGGYSGESDRCYLLKVEPQTDGTEEKVEATPASSSPAATPAVKMDDTASSSSSAPAQPSLRLTWLPLPPSARALSQAHCYGSISFHAKSGRVFVYGGLNDHGATDTLSVLALDTMTWSVALTTGQKPPPIHSHTGGIIGDHLWILGGATGSDPPRSGNDLQDVYRLDLNTMEWAFLTLRITGPRPKLTRRHQGHAVAENIVLVGVDMEGERTEEPDTATKKSTGDSTHSMHLRQRKTVSVASSSAAATPTTSATTDHHVHDAEDDEEESSVSVQSLPPDPSRTVLRPRYGGSTATRYRAGAVILDTVNLRWIWPSIATSEEGADPGPIYPRYASATTFDGRDGIHMFAGCLMGGQTLGDLWTLKLNDSLSSLPEHSPRFQVERAECTFLRETRAADRADRSNIAGGDDYDEEEEVEHNEIGGVTDLDVRDFLALYFQLQAGGGDDRAIRLPYAFGRVAAALARQQFTAEDDDDADDGAEADEDDPDVYDDEANEVDVDDGAWEQFAEDNDANDAEDEDE